MSQQVEVYRKLNFHKKGSPTVAGSIECTDSGPFVNFGGDYHNSSTYESSAYIIDGYCTGLDEKYTSGSSLRYWGGDFNVDTGSTDLTGDTYAGGCRGRLVIGTTQTNASLNGVLGQVDVGASKNIQGNVFGVDAVLDFYGACTAGSGAAFHAGAIRGTIWNEGTTTVGAGGILAGLNLYQVSGAPTLGSGAKNPAIYIRSGSTAQAWQYGIYIVNTDVKCALQVGTAYETSGSIIDGYGINLAKNYGAGSSNRTMGLEVNADTGSTDLTGDTYQAAIRGRTVIGTTQTNASLCGIIGSVDVGASKNIQGNVFGVDAVLDFYGASTAGSGASFHAGPFRGTIWNEGTTTLGAGAVLAGINLYQCSGVPTLGSGAINAGVYIRSDNQTDRWAYGIYMPANSAKVAWYSTTNVAAQTCAMNVYGVGGAGTNDIGIAAYFDATAKGLSTGNWTYGVGIWLNIDSTFAHAVTAGWAGHEQLVPLSTGVYAPAAVSTGYDDCDVIYGIKAEFVGDATAPTTNGCYFAALNVSQTAATNTAIFFAHQNEAVGMTTAKTVAAGALTLVCVNGTKYYVNLYSA